jgi:hypothetical protein
MRPHLNQFLAAVVYTCHPKLRRRLRLEDQGSRPARAKKVFETPSQRKKAGCGGMLENWSPGLRSRAKSKTLLPK